MTLRRGRHRRWGLAAAVVFFACTTVSAQDPGSNSPYIDRLKESLPTKSEDSFIEKKRQEMNDADEDTRIERGYRKLPQTGGSPAKGDSPYIDELRQSDPKGSAPTPTDGYADEQKKYLPRGERGGAIARVNAGKSALRVEKGGDPEGAFSLRLGASQSPQITANSNTQANAFTDIYGRKRWYPDFTFHYERDLFNHPYAGALGFFTQVSAATFSGIGRFGANLGSFGNASRTAYRFWVVPWTVGALYRFNAFKYVKPFVMAGPTLIGFTETRDDGKASLSGYSKAYTAVGGVAILLDWISESSDWDLYANYGIKHSYLTIETYRTSSVASDVNFKLTGVNIGFLFEF